MFTADELKLNWADRDAAKMDWLFKVTFENQKGSRKFVFFSALSTSSITRRGRREVQR